MMNDPELQEIFTDPAHQEVVDLLKASRPVAPPLDPHFRSYLRAKLMTEARRTLGPQASRSWFPFNLTPRTLAPAMAAVAAGFIVVLGVEVYLHNQSPASGPLVAANTRQINNKTDVATVEPIKIPVSGPVDKNAVEESVQIQPATSVTKQWEGNTLVIVPDHPLASNTTYTVSLKPAATVPTPNPAKPNATPQPTPPPAPVVVHFTTRPAPVPPGVPPSFKSSLVSWRYDDRLANSNTMLNASWTPAGQLLVTRPAGQPGPSATPSPSPSASAGNGGTDVWLMSANGTPLRVLAQGATLPSAAPTGGLFATWSLASGNQASLQIRDLQGNPLATVATVDGVPDRAAVWVGPDRVAYLDKGQLRVFGLHTPVNLTTTFRVDQGSLAGSTDGQLLAAQTTDHSVVIDLASGAPRTQLPQGATGFAWSSKGDLAFLVQRDGGTDLYLLVNGRYARIAASSNGQVWSDLNWSPDATSMLLASKSAGGRSTLLLINSDGTSPTAFGPAGSEYANPQWSPAGDLVLFTRRDDATGVETFWTATAMPTATDAAEQQALAEVNTFMQARIHADRSAAEAELDVAGRAAYQAGSLSLLSGAGTQFDRYYPVTIQLQSSNPNRFLVGTRIFIAKSGVETSFFEEQLILVQQDQKYLIDAASASATMPVGHGPTVVSVQVVQTASREQVQIHFDADLNAATVSEGNIKVRDLQGNDVSERVTFDPDNHLASVLVELRPGSYQLVVTTGITDINGMGMAQEYDAPIVIADR
jgi:hypothetical protein